MSNFKQLILSGKDTIKFLQSQATLDVDHFYRNADNDTYQATAMCNLKGRVQFGIWLHKTEAETDSTGTALAIIIHHSCVTELVAHIKKFGAFSKINLSEVTDIYPYVSDQKASFTTDIAQHDEQAWQAISIATGNYWITVDSQLLFQPQELRLHQRDGVSYQKGCYLGQEVIARIYFRSAPKAFLHRITAVGSVPNIGDKIGDNNKIQVVNAIAVSSTMVKDSADPADDCRFEALVIARDNHLLGVESLPLPAALQEDVARKTKT